MPWAYCRSCDGEISGIREQYEGCKQCGHKEIQVDDGDTKEMITFMLYEIDELKEKVQYLDRLEEWLWGRHHEHCPHRDKSQRRGMEDGCNLSITHGCSNRRDCDTFPQREEEA